MTSAAFALSPPTFHAARASKDRKIPANARRDRTRGVALEVIAVEARPGALPDPRPSFRNIDADQSRTGPQPDCPETTAPEHSDYAPSRYSSGAPSEAPSPAGPAVVEDRESFRSP